MNATQQHQHEWTETATVDDGARTFACTGCPATATACTTCAQILATSGRTCDRCVSQARNTLREVRDLYRALPDVIAAIGGLHAIRYDQRGNGKTRTTDTTIIGGAAFVMAGPGTSPDRGLQLGRGETTEAIAELSAAETTDPPSVLGVLTGWEDAWRVEQHQHGAPRTTVDDAVDYLLTHTTWAAQHSDRWTEYLTDLRTLRGRLTFVTGSSRAPQEAGVPCPYCAGRIIQKWTTTGLDDTRECDTCHLTWASEAHFMLAIRQAHQSLPDTHPDQLVTLDDARRIFRGQVKRNTLNVWVKRDREREADGRTRAIPERGTDVRGIPLYRLGDIAARIGAEQLATA